MDENWFFKKSEGGKKYEVLSVEYVRPYSCEPKAPSGHARLNIVIIMNGKERRIADIIPWQIVMAEQSYIEKIKLGWYVRIVLGLSQEHLARVKGEIEGYEQLLREEEMAKAPPDHSLLFPGPADEQEPK